MARRRYSRGFALVGVLILAIMLVILTAALVFWVQHESRVSVKHRKSTTAFHLAEAAVDRGRWKLQQTNTYWTVTSAGGAVAHYNFDKAFSDVEGGDYTVRISCHSTNPDRRIIVGAGRDASTKEVRRIYAEFERESLDSAIYSGGEVEIDGNNEVHWGPVKSQDEIDLGGAAASLRFPRLYSRGAIKPEPPYCEDPGCAAKTDNIQYFAYYDVPPRPIIDFDAMKSSAQANGTYFTTPQDWNNASPTGSCTGCPAGVKEKLDDNLIWYFDIEGVGSGRLRLRGNKYLYGTFIVMGELELEGGGSGEYTTTPPADANLEYKIIDTAAANEWYGDAGGGPPSDVSANFEFRTGGATPDQKDGIKDGVSIRGLLYAKEEFEAKGGNIVHGMIIIEKDEVDNTGSVIIFYDRNAAENVTISNAKLVLKVWREEPGSWPSGL